jgi:hypothetical protein
MGQSWMCWPKGFVWFVGVALTLFGTASPGVTAQYQLRLANLRDRLFASYIDQQGRPFRAQYHILPGLEASLEQDFPLQLLIDRHVRVMSPQGISVPPYRAGVVVNLPNGDGAWTLVRWDGTPGAYQVLRISSHDAHYQELTAVAVKRDGVLRVLPIHGIPLFGPQKLLAPAVPSTYIDYALERGTFDALMQKHAISSDGLSVLVGRHHDPRYPDQLYVRVQMPLDEKQYTVVLAWKDRDELRRDGEDKDRN